jgi:hypothetical protein
MKDLPVVISPDRWIIQLFSARAAAEGGILRRSVDDVERLVGRQRFYREIRRRGFHAIENAGQFVIFCNQDEIAVVV